MLSLGAMIKPETTNPLLVPTPSCERCNDSTNPFPLLPVSYQGTYTVRRLCASCVLLEHRHSFCPTCFQVYAPTPSPDDAVTCGSCRSLSHSGCVAPTSPPYICPLCVSPSFYISNVQTARGLEIDEESARKLMAAAKIASLSVNSLAVAAQEKGDRKRREAAVAQERAKQAKEYTQHLADLVKKEACNANGNMKLFRACL